MSKTLGAISLILFAGLSFSQMQTTDFNLYYESDAYKLTSNHSSILDSITKNIRHKDYGKVLIFAYCDTVGDSTYNQELAMNRAKPVFDYYLQKIKLDSNRIRVVVIGENQMRYRNPKDFGKNRRVRIKMTHGIKTFSMTNMEEVTVGSRLVIPNLNFFPDSPELLPSSIPMVDSVYYFLKNNPNIVVELSGHVCCAPGQELSEQRSKTIREMLLRKGIPINRMTFKGYSNSFPLAPERSEKNRALNRRVEVTILKM